MEEHHRHDHHHGFDAVMIRRLVIAAVLFAAGLFTEGPLPALSTVLNVLAILTAGYLLTIVIRGFFPGEGFDAALTPKAEPGWRMLLPLCLLAAAVLALGMFPGGMIAFAQALARAVL